MCRRCRYEKDQGARDWRAGGKRDRRNAETGNRNRERWAWVEDDNKYGVVMQVIARDFWDGANLPLSHLPKKESVRGLFQQRHTIAEFLTSREVVDVDRVCKERGTGHLYRSEQVVQDSERCADARNKRAHSRQNQNGGVWKIRSRAGCDW